MEKKYFYGNEVSEYGLENGYVDYGTLAKVGDCVLCNDITKLFYGNINKEYVEPEIISGTTYDEENDEYIDIFQYFIISSNMVNILKEANENVYYIETLDMYVWGVTHFGTSWDYVLTDIKYTDYDYEREIEAQEGVENEYCRSQCEMDSCSGCPYLTR